ARRAIRWFGSLGTRMLRPGQCRPSDFRSYLGRRMSAAPLMKASDSIRTRAGRIVRRLARLYPDAQCALHHENPLQLLIATILSAQCTDARVNQVTPDLFRRFPDAKAFAMADPRDLEAAIQSTGFFRNKARNIQACCKQLLSQY